jgi:uncharacterized protein (DUF1501 family)
MNMEVCRRRFLLGTGATLATLSVALTGSSQTCGAALPFVITVQANGAWDPTFLIDPVGGDAGFTPFLTTEILSSGAVRYAPYTNDAGVVTPYLVGDAQADFFQKHAARMIVWNGVDNATVSHDVGPRVAFTGSTRDGLPSLSGLVAGLQGASMPLAMFVAGGYASTGGLVPITRGGSLSLLQGLADPNRDGIHSESVNELVRAATRDRDARLALASQLPRARLAYEQILTARSGALEERFREIAEVLQRATGRVGNPLADTASGVLALMNSGATAAAHLSVGGFDTHTNHDALNNGQREALATLLVGLDYIIDAAAADPVLAARGVLVVVGSDFGRTRYNDAGGKDHWPVTSMMAFGIGAAEALVSGGKVIGATSPTGQNGVEALPVKVEDGRVLVTETGDPAAFRLTPAHVQLSLRSALGLCPTDAPNDPLRPFTLQVQPQEPLPLQS